MNKAKLTPLQLLLVVVLIPFASMLTAQTSDPFFKSYEVSSSVHMLEAPDAGGNIGVFSGADGVLLIDDRFDQDTPALLEAVSRISDKEIRFLVNTHIHPDHIGGNNNLAAYGVTILAHESVRLKMLTELKIPRRGGITFPQPPEQARPVITFSDAISFHLNNEEVRVFLAPPAHTDGDSFVHFIDSDVLHLGDVFRTNMYPIVDKFNGGSFLGMIEAMQIAIDLAGPETKVIPGHGRGVSDREGMVEVMDLLVTLRDRVQSAIDAGDKLETILNAKITADLDGRWGGVPSWNASDILPIVFEELHGL